MFFVYHDIMLRMGMGKTENTCENEDVTECILLNCGGVLKL